MECYNFKCKSKNCQGDKYKIAACLSRQTKEQAAYAKTIYDKRQCGTCHSKMIPAKLKYSKRNKVRIYLCTSCGAIKKREWAA